MNATEYEQGTLPLVENWSWIQGHLFEEAAETEKLRGCRETATEEGEYLRAHDQGD